MDKLKPMLATDIEQADHQPWDDAAWVMEKKYDGIRLVWSNEGGAIHYYARTGNDHTGRYTFLDDLPLPPDTILDGEILVPGGVSSDAMALCNRDKLVYVVFDTVKVDGHDVRQLPWGERRELLEFAMEDYRLVANGRVHNSLVLPPDLSRADAMMAGGEEGVVLKEIASTYQAGRRSMSWLKMKAAQEYDVVITDCDSPPTAGSLGDRNGWCVLSFGFYIGGKLVRCGSVGQSEPHDVQAAKIGKVAVLRANGMLNKEEGSLRHPRLIRFRTDKKPEECSL